MKRLYLFVLFFLVAGLSAAYGDVLLVGGPNPAPESSPAHRNVIGTVAKIEGGALFLKTEEGTTRDFAVKESQKEGLKSLKVGDQVTLQLDEGNQIVDIHKEAPLAESAPGDKGGAIPNGEMGGHRSVSGTIEAFDPAQMNVTIRSDEGKTERFELKDPAMTKLTYLKDGERVALEIDEQNRVLDAHLG